MLCIIIIVWQVKAHQFASEPIDVPTPSFAKLFRRILIGSRGCEVRECLGKRRSPGGTPAPVYSNHMRDRVQQKGQKRQGQDDKSPFAPMPLKRQKQETPHSSNLLQVFTASR